MTDTADRLSRAGWVWVLIAVVAVALLVWWVAAAVDDADPGVPSDETAEVEQIEPSESRPGHIQQTPGEVQEGEAAAGTQGTPGQTRRFGEGAAPARLEQYVDWVEQQSDDPRIDPAFAVRGMDMLVAAVDDVIEEARRYDSVGKPGEQIGGGPLDSPGFDQYYQAAKQSIAELERAGEARRAAVFNTAATDIGSLLAQIHERTGSTGLQEEVADLQRTVHAIRPDLRLDEQGERVHQFFERSARVAVQLARSFQPASPGAINPP